MANQNLAVGGIALLSFKTKSQHIFAGSINLVLKFEQTDKDVAHFWKEWLVGTQSL